MQVVSCYIFEILFILQQQCTEDSQTYDRIQVPRLKGMVVP